MKVLLFLLLFVAGTTWAGEKDSCTTQNIRELIINYANGLIGTPYEWGGTDISGFDCTGFVYHVFKQFGIIVSRASSGYEHYSATSTEPEKAKPGDIILFTGTNASVKKVGHAGIIYRNDNGVIDFIHSSSSSKHCGVVITRYNESGYVKRYLRIIDVIS